MKLTAERIAAMDFEGLADGFDETTVALVRATADYGHYVQPYLSRVHGWTIGTDYAEMPAHSTFTADTVSVARTVAASYGPSVTLPADGSVTSVGVGLDLTSSTDAYLDATVASGTEVVSATLADGTALTVSKVSDAMWRITMPNIMAQDLANTYDVTITTGGGSTTRVRASAMSFACVVLGSDKYKDDEAALYMATALCRYWQAADAYIKAHE